MRKRRQHLGQAEPPTNTPDAPIHRAPDQLDFSDQHHGPAAAHHQPKHDANTARPRHSHIRSVIATISVIIAAPIIAILLTLFVFQQYQVDGVSMQPTLQNGNRLIVLKAPRTWARITGHPYIPNRGDIVIFKESNLYNLTQSGSETLVKRVIGLPGDHIVVKNGVLTIYNKQHPKGFEPDKTLHLNYEIGRTNNDVNLVVPPDEIFVCGDNRPNSLDSRIFGPVPVKNIIGKLVLRITPLSEIEEF